VPLANAPTELALPGEFTTKTGRSRRLRSRLSARRPRRPVRGPLHHRVLPFPGKPLGRAGNRPFATSKAAVSYVRFAQKPVTRGPLGECLISARSTRSLSVRYGHKMPKSRLSRRATTRSSASSPSGMTIIGIRRQNTATPSLRDWLAEHRDKPRHRPRRKTRVRAGRRAHVTRWERPETTHRAKRPIIPERHPPLGTGNFFGEMALRHGGAAPGRCPGGADLLPPACLAQIRLRPLSWPPTRTWARRSTRSLSGGFWRTGRREAAS
jgi:hypothetical protein